MVSPLLIGPYTASMMLRVPQATSATNRSMGYADPPVAPPRCLTNRVRFAALSAAVMVVPSTAHTSIPRQRT